MHYDKKLKQVLKNSSIWGKRFNEVNDNGIEGVKNEISSMGKQELERMLYTISLGRETMSDIMNAYIGGFSILIPMGAMIVSLSRSPNSVIASMFIFVLGLLAYIALINCFILPRAKQRNQKIGSIEIAINELLQEEFVVKGIYEDGESEIEAIPSIEKENSTIIYKVYVTEI